MSIIFSRCCKIVHKMPVAATRKKNLRFTRRFSVKTWWHTITYVRVYANFKKLYNLLLCKIFEIWYIKIGWNSSKLNNTKPMPLTLDHCSVIIKYFSLFFNKTSLGNWLCRIFFFFKEKLNESGKKLQHKI